MVSIPSVAMKGCTLPRVMTRPLTSPSSAPTASPPPMPTSTGRPAASNPAITAPENASTEPTLRSMPPVRITNVMPAAMTALMETCRAMLSRLLTVRNDPLSTERTTRSSAKAMAMPKRRSTFRRRASGSLRSVARPYRRLNCTPHPPPFGRRPAAGVAHVLSGQSHRHIEIADGLGDKRGLFQPPDEERHRQPPHDRQRDVRAHAHRQHETQPLPIFRHQTDAQSDGVGRGADAHRPSVQQDLARVERRGPKDGMGDLCFARTDQSRDSQNLAMAEDETDIAEEPLYRQPTNIQDGGTERYVFLRKLLRQPAADHQADEFVHRQPGNRVGADMQPVAQRSE